MSDQANLGDGGNNGQKPAWTAQLDGDLQSNERLTSFQTIGEMGKAFLESEGKLQGFEEKLQGAVFVPGESATDEDRAAFYNKLGRPESAENYSMTKPEGLPEEVPYSEDVEGAFKQLAFETGISDVQAEQMHNWYWNTVKQGLEQEQQATNEAVNKLKDEWKGDAFAENTKLAERAFGRFGDDEMKTFMETAKVNGISLGDHPVFLRLFHKVGEAISDDILSGGDRSSSGAVLSDEDLAKARFPKTYGKG